MKPTYARGRVLRRLGDLFAFALVVLALWRVLIAPRFLAPPGQPMPATTLTSPDGQSYRLAGPPHRTLFVDFWASWCEPCRLSLPLVERYARAHPEVAVLAVDVGEPGSVASGYARAHDLAHVLLDSRGATATAFGVVAYPTMVVIDPRGFVRAKWSGFNPAIGLAMANAERELARASAATGP
jgi:thiol-disulfide isomerase/thioredoxin